MWVVSQRHAFGNISFPVAKQTMKTGLFIAALLALAALMYVGDRVDDADCPVQLGVLKAEAVLTERFGGERLYSPNATWVSGCSFDIHGDLLVESGQTSQFVHPTIRLSYDGYRWSER